MLAQALRYKIWDLGLASKSHYKGKIWAFGTKLGLFWDHFWTFPGLLSRYFHENAKNVRKGQNNIYECIFAARFLRLTFRKKMHL